MVNKHLHAAIYCRSARNFARAMADQGKRCKRKAVDEGDESTVTIIVRPSHPARTARPSRSCAAFWAAAASTSW